LNRGLQDIIKALKIIEDKNIEFHVYGNLPEHSNISLNDLIKELKFINKPAILFHDSISPEDILKRTAFYDVGMAVEPGFCDNNKMALSNKIFTYLAGGIAIIFSDTPAKRQFYEQYQLGFIYKPGDYKTLATIISRLYLNAGLLNEQKLKSQFLFNTELNWENEQRIIIRKLEEIFNKDAIRTKVNAETFV